MQRRNQGQWPQKYNRLYQQYALDQYSKMEDSRLSFIAKNQNKLRTTNMKSVVDVVSSDRLDPDPTFLGKRTYLPSSFIGSPRNMLPIIPRFYGYCTKTRKT